VSGLAASATHAAIEYAQVTGGRLAVWKAFDEDSEMTIVFANTVSSRLLPNLDGLEALDASLQCHEP
jgi:hypothetical protein